MNDEMLSHLRMIESHLEGEKSLESILLAKGVWFEGRADSAEYPKAKKWKQDFKPRIQDCWYNAQMFCVGAFNSGPKNVRYFEGYVLMQPGILPDEHGWVVMPEGRVVDFTAEALELVVADKGIQLDTKEALYVGVEIPIEIVVLARPQAYSCGPLAEALFCGEDD